MPQLDVTTYLGQVTWFSRVFVGFYLAMVTDVLPALNRAVKIRGRKLEVQKGALGQFSGVRVAGEDQYDGSQGRVDKKLSGRVSIARSVLGGSKGSKPRSKKWTKLALTSVKARLGRVKNKAKKGAGVRFAASGKGVMPKTVSGVKASPKKGSKSS